VSLESESTEILAPLACYIAWIGSYLPTFRDNISAQLSAVKHYRLFDRNVFSLYIELFFNLSVLVRLLLVLLLYTGTAIPLQALAGPEGSRRLRRHMKVARLSSLRTGLLYPHKIFLVLISVRV
jgi:hypothetical protein